MAVLAGAIACSDSTSPPRPVLALSQSTQTFASAVGGFDPAPADIVITTTGTGTASGLMAVVTYGNGEPTGWLAATLDQTTAPATLTLTVTALSAVGTYHGTVLVSSPTAASSPQLITATYNVAGRGSFYMIRDLDNMFQRMDPSTLAITNIGRTTANYQFGDCAWDAADGKLYMSDGRSTNSLYTINLATGAATLVGVHGLEDMFALAWDSATSTLYGAAGSYPNYNLYRMNQTTGAATLVGSLGILEYLSGMAWESKRSELIGISAGFATIYSINTTTGIATATGGAGLVNDNGLAYDPVIDRLWVADYNGNLYSLDAGNLSYGRTTEATAIESHTCITYVP